MSYGSADPAIRRHGVLLIATRPAATEELDVARELLASSAEPPQKAEEPAPVKHSGQCVRSLMPHIRQRK